MRARVYDEEMQKVVTKIGIENIRKKLVNLKEDPSTFQKVIMTIKKLLEYGSILVAKEESMKHVQLAIKAHFQVSDM